MSTTSKVVLGVSVVLTLSTVAAVHLNQSWDRQVTRSVPSRAGLNANSKARRLHEGVVRDLERLERKKENLRLLEEQRTLTAQLEAERQRRQTG
ncbi:hypothetical protein FQN60_006033 [Etheostoma spectabile]|uniref:PET117 cytochrome c oxidase chaperone n=2 Tax=Etheostoma spectabile TaxID=54343 RepID=A0A5J5CBL1_9PERO|nr:hypothetical protein FQN60_006033 [Etheostoma spectabile]